MDNYNLPEENETDNTVRSTQPTRSWRDLLHEILAPKGPEEVSDYENDDDEE